MTIKKSEVDEMIYLITCSTKEDLMGIKSEDLMLIPVFSCSLEEDLIKIQQQQPSWKIIGIQNLAKLKKQILLLENFKNTEVLATISKKTK